jgi:hypothetical protein
MLLSAVMRFVPDDVMITSLMAFSELNLPGDIARVILFDVDARCSIPFQKESVEMEVMRLDARLSISNPIYRVMPYVFFPDEYALTNQRNTKETELTGKETRVNVLIQGKLKTFPVKSTLIYRTPMYKGFRYINKPIISILLFRKNKWGALIV